MIFLACQIAHYAALLVINLLFDLQDTYKNTQKNAKVSYFLNQQT